MDEKYWDENGRGCAEIHMWIYYKVWNIYVDMIQVNKYAKNMQNELDPFGSTYGIRHINHSSPKTYSQLR
jgi:hypothetical protein